MKRLSDRISTLQPGFGLPSAASASRNRVRRSGSSRVLGRERAQVLPRGTIVVRFLCSELPSFVTHMAELLGQKAGRQASPSR